MAGVKKIGAGRAKQAGSIARGKAKQKPLMGKPQPAMVPNRKNAKPKTGTPSIVSTVKTHVAKQKPFKGIPQRVIEIAGRVAKARYQHPGVSSSKAQVAPAVKPRMNSKNFTGLLQGDGHKVNTKRMFTSSGSKAADMVGTTATRKSTKKTTGGPKVAGPKIRYSSTPTFSSTPKPKVIKSGK